MNFLNEQNLNNQNKSLVCKVMTSYGTTLVVILQPNQITQKALSEAIELKHKTLYGEEYGSNVRCTRIDGFSRVNDEGAPCGVSYPIDDESLKTVEFVSYLAQLTKGGALTAENNKNSNSNSNNNNQKKNKNQSNAAMDIDGFNKEVLSPKSLIDANVKAAAKGSTPLSSSPHSTNYGGGGGGRNFFADDGGETAQRPSLKSRFANEVVACREGTNRTNDEGTHLRGADTAYARDIE